MTKKHLFAASAAAVVAFIIAPGCGSTDRVNVSAPVAANDNKTESTPYKARYKVEEFAVDGLPASETFYVDVDFDDATRWTVVTTDESGGNKGLYGGQKIVRDGTIYEKWSHTYDLHDAFSDEELATAMEKLDTNEQMAAVQSIIDSGVLEYRSIQDFSFEVDPSDRSYDVPFAMTALAPATYGKTAGEYWKEEAQAVKPGLDGAKTFTVNNSTITVNRDGIVTRVAEPYEPYARIYTLDYFE